MNIRDATAEDAPFLAQAVVGADRGHTGIGSWDHAFPGDERDRLRLLEAIIRSDHPSYLNWSIFLIADVDAAPVATVATFVPARLPVSTFDTACRNVIGDAATDRMLQQPAWSRDFFAVVEPSDALRLEWVYTHPSVRRQGVSGQLIDEALRRGAVEGGV